MSDLVLVPGQAAAVDMVGLFRAQEEHRIGRITGYAGTGKTTLIREIADRFGTPYVLTPTGKAALRVGEATGLYASTIHRFLYDPSEDPKTGKPIFKLKNAWDDSLVDMEGKLVLIDEASMVDQFLWRDLLHVAEKVKFHVLLMGDLFQLPPIFKDESGRSFSTLTIPTPFEVNLTEVVRQALDSPIIRASMVLRSGRPEYEALDMLGSVLEADLMYEAMAVRGNDGVVICFTNRMRHDLNTRQRDTLGLEPGALLAGEPIMVTQNNYKLNCWNGEVIPFESWERAPTERGGSMTVVDRYTTSSLQMQFGVGLACGSQKAIISPQQVTGESERAKIGTGTLKRAARAWYRTTVPYADEPPSYLDCNYGYTLTCHKAQGSEWDEVIVVMEDKLFMLRGVDKKRWLYTAITRAKKRVSCCYTRD